MYRGWDSWGENERNGCASETLEPRPRDLLVARVARAGRIASGDSGKRETARLVKGVVIISCDYRWKFCRGADINIGRRPAFQLSSRSLILPRARFDPIRKATHRELLVTKSLRLPGNFRVRYRRPRLSEMKVFRPGRWNGR